MTTQTPILKMVFRDVMTGQVIEAHVTFEQWDNMVQVYEKMIAEFYKDKGLKKDLR